MIHAYALSQWILFFFIYSFAGWIWECCYVSAKEHHWVNRGFLHGPFLPIYGSGALTVIVTTIAFRKNLALVFLIGMISATILEYVTGAVMEKMFHVRYWDYSKNRFNLNGHICLGASLGWGVFSVILIRFVHVPIEDMVVSLPILVTDIVGFVLSIITAADFTQSFNEAMDMKRILTQLDESRTQIKKMQEKLKLASEDAIEDLREEYREYAEKKSEEARTKKEQYLVRIHQERDRRRRQLTELSDRVELLLTERLPEKIDDLIGEERREELDELKRNISREFQKMNERTDKSYLSAVNHLRRNPAAVSEKFKEALQELKDYMNAR